MTDEEIDKMEAGPELDERIALLLGWQRDPRYAMRWIPPGKKIPKDGVFYTGSPDRYSDDIAAAWEVVEDMRKHEFWASMRNAFGEEDLDDGCWCGFTPLGVTGWNGRPDHWTRGATMPEAICRAALKAVNAKARP